MHLDCCANIKDTKQVFYLLERFIFSRFLRCHIPMFFSHCTSQSLFLCLMSKSYNTQGPCPRSLLFSISTYFLEEFTQYVTLNVKSIYLDLASSLRPLIPLPDA